MRRHLVWIVCPMLTACFLEQKAPPSEQPVTAPFAGIVAIEDASGWQQGGTFQAVFGERSGTRSPSRRSFALATKKASRAPECEIKKQPKTTARPAEATYMDVGKILFGPALQSAAVEVSPDEQGRYRKELPDGIAAGLYQVVASGKGNIAQFGDLLSMPETIGSPTGNNVRFEDGIPLLHGSSLEIEWDRPAIANESNLLLVDFIAESDTERFEINCFSTEAAFGTATERLSWTIGSDLMKQLPVTNTAAVYFVRAHARRVGSNQIVLDLQGLRTYVAAAAIFP